SSTKLVAVSFVAGDFFETEVLILPRPFKDHVAFPYPKLRGVLWNSDHALLEVGKHLVGLTNSRTAGNSVTLHALGLAEEEKCPALLSRGHSTVISSCKFVDRRVSKDEREFKFGNCFAEHEEIDGRSGCNFRKHLAKKLPIGRACVQER